MKDLIEKMLAAYCGGDDPSLKETPERYQRALEELLGEGNKPAPLLKTFPCEIPGNLIFFGELETTTLCPHHLLPYYITASFAYIPINEVVGISKPGRLLKWACGRLILQEAVGELFVKEFEKQVRHGGLALLLEGHHLCSSIRGIKQANNKTITISMKLSPEDEARFWRCTELSKRKEK